MRNATSRQQCSPFGRLAPARSDTGAASSWYGGKFDVALHDYLRKKLDMLCKGRKVPAPIPPPVITSINTPMPAVMAAERSGVAD